MRQRANSPWPHEVKPVYAFSEYLRCKLCGQRTTSMVVMEQHIQTMHSPQELVEVVMV